MNTESQWMFNFQFDYFISCYIKIMQGKISYCPEPLQNKSQKWPFRESLQSAKMAYRKLMIYQVITSQNSLFTVMSPQANKLTKRALGVNVYALKIDQNSNLRAFAFILIKLMFGAQLIPLAGQQVINVLKQMQNQPPNMKNHKLSNKFTTSEMLQIFAAMLYKTGDLIQGSLSINQIIQVYSNYLDLVVFFLRCLLSKINMQRSIDFSQILPTIQTYSILSQYFDISYIVNKHIYLFPDLKTFIASPDDQQFVFGKFYDNVEELNKYENQIRESTINHIQQQNQNYQSKKIDCMNLQVSISQIFSPQKMGQLNSGNFSKAPTPQFGEGDIQGFSKQFDQEISNAFQNQNKKQTILNMDQIRSQYDHNINLPKQYFIPERQSTLYESLNILRKPLRNTQSMRPTIHEDMFHNYLGTQHKHKQQNPQHNTQIIYKISRQNKSMKGGSMMEQQISLFKYEQKHQSKQLQHKSVSRQRVKHRRNREQNNSINNLASQHKRSRVPSPNSQNAKSEHYVDFRSDTSQNTTKKKSMKINSDVYNINIQSEFKSKNNKQKINNLENSKYKKLNQNVKELLSSVKFINSNIKQKPINPNKIITYQGKTQYNKKKNGFYNHNHNHIHIHIHNQGQTNNNVSNQKIKQQISKETQNKYQISSQQRKRQQKHEKSVNNAKLAEPLLLNIPMSSKYNVNSIKKDNSQTLNTHTSKNKVKHYPFTQSQKILYPQSELNTKHFSFYSDANPINLSFNHNKIATQGNKVYKQPSRKIYNMKQKIEQRFSREHSFELKNQNKSAKKFQNSIHQIPSFLKNKSKHKLINDKSVQQNSQTGTTHSKKEKKIPRLEMKTKLQQIRKTNEGLHDLKSATSLKKFTGKQSGQIKTPTFNFMQYIKK